jgi:hypothetical protein
LFRSRRSIYCHYECNGFSGTGYDMFSKLEQLPFNLLKKGV